ncbi:MAG: hypothetical protein WA304_13980 [Candidatus Cybelea sp.]
MQLATPDCHGPSEVSDPEVLSTLFCPEALVVELLYRSPVMKLSHEYFLANLRWNATSDCAQKTSESGCGSLGKAFEDSPGANHLLCR